jgi:uncharacterized protein YdeI (YjbR/CyaY-like superfamily)
MLETTFLLIGSSAGSILFAMAKSPAAKKTFTAMLERDGTRLHWVVVRVPFDIAKAWPVRRGRSVRGTIEEFDFRTTLFPHPKGGGLVLLVNKAMRAAAGAHVGAKVRITLEPDLEEREVTIPPEVQKELKGNRRLQKWIDQLSPSMRREIGKWVCEPKSAESRAKRAAKMAERLFQAMEGESDPPPVLKMAFQRQPLAKDGWEALTPAQRRNHLLGIFYYETPEARERRAEKAVEEALSRLKAGRGRAQHNDE